MSSSRDPETARSLADPHVEQRHGLVLRAWEAINTQRELATVLEAVGDVLVPVVPFDGIGIVAFEGGRGRLHALHIVRHPSGTECAVPVDPGSEAAKAQVPTNPPRAYEGSDLQGKLRAGLPYTCSDILGEKARFPHEFRLAAVGIRAYASIPLFVTGSLIGTAVFGRRAAKAFADPELMVLSDVSRAVGVAVANALANEEIRKLRDQLEAENIVLRSQIGQRRFDEIVGESAALRRMLDALEQVAATDTTVLITGETGTGKELAVRALHRLSARAHGPLVKVNCSAIPETLIAAELFGHERGAFTGATERRKGRFEQAQGGTLFLDEVGELPPDTQVMLLRVLQEREFERLGGRETVRVDVRLAAATNHDLAEHVRVGRFRSDLYYRLNVFPLRIPPLRERPEDIPLLVAHFVAKHGGRLGRTIVRIERRSMGRLESHTWPGNVRELENVIERALILSRNGILRLDREALPGLGVIGDIGADIRVRERQAVEEALRASAGRVAGRNGAAVKLGLAPSTLEFRIRRLGINKFQYRMRGK